MAAYEVENFPKSHTLGRDGTQVIIRPLEQGDGPELLEFFRRIPEEDRFYLKENVTSPDVIDDWVSRIDYSRVLPLVALVDDEIVADATLHWSRARARRQMGEIRIVVDPRFRERGLGTVMVGEVVDLAHAKGLVSLFFELVEGKEDTAIEVAARLGFRRVATLPNFVTDMDGTSHNLAVMQFRLEDWIKYWAF